jgi:hypothetical protein
VDRDELYGGALQLALVELLRQRLVTEVIVPNPGVGVEISQVVPAGEVWELLAASYRFTSSAVVANRRSSLRVRDPNARLLAQADAPAVQAAGVAVDYVYEQDLGPAAFVVVSAQQIPMQGTPLPPGFVISTITQLLDVGDFYSNISLMVRQWSPHEVEQNAAWLANVFY